jgi:dolichol-phosphate mannosyltransferase
MVMKNREIVYEKAKQILIIIPTYNEVQNIRDLVPLVLSQDQRIDILVVDDNSPDGTAAAVDGLMDNEPRLNLIKRDSKMGLGTAYVAGFRFALKADYDLIFEMDADFSHDPAEIPNFISNMDDNGLVIGSRYIKGVNVINWPISRLILSWLANLYTRIVTGLSVKDATSGYKCFKRGVLESIDLDMIHSDGYAFQIEMDYKAWKNGYRILEIPIVFVDRNIGISKMNPGIIREAVWIVWKLRLLSIFKKL